MIFNNRNNIHSGKFTEWVKYSIKRFFIRVFGKSLILTMVPVKNTTQKKVSTKTKKIKEDKKKELKEDIYDFPATTMHRFGHTFLFVMLALTCLYFVKGVVIGERIEQVAEPTRLPQSESKEMKEIVMTPKVYFYEDTGEEKKSKSKNL